jgi:hypothetical protein
MNFRPRTAWAGVMALAYPTTAFLQAYSGLMRHGLQKQGMETIKKGRALSPAFLKINMLIRPVCGAAPASRPTRHPAGQPSSHRRVPTPADFEQPHWRSCRYRSTFAKFAQMH